MGQLQCQRIAAEKTSVTNSNTKFHGLLERTKFSHVTKLNKQPDYTFRFSVRKQKQILSKVGRISFRML